MFFSPNILPMDVAAGFLRTPMYPNFFCFQYVATNVRLYLVLGLFYVLYM